MRTAGIIGGLGPETTAQFYQEVIFDSFQQYKIGRPPLLIWSIPLESITPRQRPRGMVGKHDPR